MHASFVQTKGPGGPAVGGKDGHFPAGESGRRRVLLVSEVAAGGRGQAGRRERVSEGGQAGGVNVRLSSRICANVFVCSQIRPLQ